MNSSSFTRRIQTVIPPGEAGRPLLDYLSTRFTYHSREIWEKLIHAGNLKIDERLALPEEALKAGGVLSFSCEGISEPEVDTAFEVCWEDEAYLVVNKPPNLPVHPAGRYFNHTLWGELRRRGIAEAPCFINRLDRETSGLVLIAKRTEDAAAAQRLFQKGAVAKHYLALVEGDFRLCTGEANLYCSGMLVPAGGAVRKKRALHTPCLSECLPQGQGKDWAVTRFQSRAFFPKNGISLVEAEAITGRLHQIRASLLSLGYPIVGDKLYGTDERLFLAFLSDALTDADHQQLRLPYQALHAARLTLPHPLTGAHLSFEAPPPATWFAVMV